MRYFKVFVDFYATRVEEVFEPLKSYDWRGSIDGESVQYKIVKDTTGTPRNWFERGTVEVQYHAKTVSKTGFVAWQTMSKAPRRENKKRAAIKAKMGKLI